MDSRKTRKPDYAKKSLKEQFFANVEKQGDCWIWIGDTVRKPPVPILRCKEGYAPARRLSLKFAGFETTKRIRNQCGNPLCVRPEHLYIPGNKIQEIVALKQSGEYSTEEIASSVGLPVFTVQQRLLNHRRRDLNPENVLSGKASGEVPGYYMLGEAKKLTGLPPYRLIEIAKKNGWEFYRIGRMIFFQAEHIESLLSKDEQN